MLKNSEQDDVALDSSYLEYNIFSLIKIDLTDLIKKKVTLAKEFKIPPSEIDNMYMWEFEMFLEELNDIIKKENDKFKEEESKYNLKSLSKGNASSYMRKNFIPSISTKDLTKAGL